jgi:hypothetical protein
MSGIKVFNKLSHAVGETTAPAVDPRIKITDMDRMRFERLLREKMSRDLEATNLYEPLPNQLAFHKSQAMERVARGSNQAGKTLCSAMELAWIVSNRHPYVKYPKKGKIIAVGNSEEHIGNVMWDKLTKEDSDFRRIKDLETGKWRSYRRFDPADKSRFSETKPMTPLIPQRLIAGEPSWYSKKDSIPRKVRFKTGWELLFFTGGGKPPQGIAVDVVWFDEEIEKDAWYLEMAARVLRKGGRFIWSATAQAGGDQLWNLHLRAMEELGSLNPSVTEHPILLSDNMHVEQKLKDELAKKYAHDPDAYRVRILGEYLITSFHIYPTFSITNHCIEPFDIPSNWCRYMIVDPGTVVCAVLFVAVPPDQSHLYIYDELYIRDCDPQKFGDMLYHKTQGQIFQSFIIDDNGSRRTDASSGTTVRQVYADVLQSRGIKSRATQSSFELGASNVVAGLESVRKALHPKEKNKDGKPYIQIFLGGTGGCPNLIEEFPRYHKKRNKITNTLSEEPMQKHNHALDCLRYAVMHGCPYVEPKPIKIRSASAMYMDKKRKKHRKKHGKSSIVLG